MEFRRVVITNKENLNMVISEDFGENCQKMGGKADQKERSVVDAQH